jgi:hypothetical protein
MHATGADSIEEASKAVLEFGRFFVGELWDSYVSKSKRPETTEV